MIKKCAVCKEEGAKRFKWDKIEVVLCYDCELEVEAEYMLFRIDRGMYKGYNSDTYAWFYWNAGSLKRYVHDDSIKVFNGKKEELPNITYNKWIGKRESKL